MKKGLEVAVGGGGVCGLTAALVLQHLPGIAKIRVFDRAAGPDPGSARAALGVGLWSTALRKLELLHQRHATFAAEGLPSVVRELEGVGSYLQKAGYRAPGGQWLAWTDLGYGEGKTLGEVDDTHAALLFVRQGQLHEIVRDAVLARNKLGAEVEIRGGAAVKSVSRSDSGERVRIAFDGGKQDVEADLFIAADGASSKLRTIRNGGVEQRLQHRGYRVFRGIAELPKDKLYMRSSVDFSGSFQTWGHGNNMRFAAVPLKSEGDYTEQWVWFATVASQEGSELPENVRSYLLNTFSKWHPEVNYLISATDEEGFVIDEAKALPTALIRRRTSRHVDLPLTLLGDAAHVADPVLAQGYTIGMEDAIELGFQLEKLLKVNPSSAFQLDSLVPSRTRLLGALRAFEAARVDRVVRLEIISELVQSMSQPQTSVIGSLRDLGMLSAPQLVKEPVFRSLIEASLSPKSNRVPLG